MERLKNAIAEAEKSYGAAFQKLSNDIILKTLSDKARGKEVKSKATIIKQLAKMNLSKKVMDRAVARLK